MTNIKPVVTLDDIAIPIVKSC